MAFGKWRKVGIAVEVEGKMYIIPQDDSGRLIYEEYDTQDGKSGEDSKFYEVNTLNLIPRVETDKAEVIGHLKLNLSDDSVKELTEDT